MAREMFLQVYGKKEDEKGRTGSLVDTKILLVFS